MNSKTIIIPIILFAFLLSNCRKDVAIQKPVTVEKTYSFKTGDTTQIYHEMLPIWGAPSTTTYGAGGNFYTNALGSFPIENIDITFSSSQSDNYGGSIINSLDKKIEFAILDSLIDTIPAYVKTVAFGSSKSLMLIQK